MINKHDANLKLNIITRLGLQCQTPTFGLAKTLKNELSENVQCFMVIKNCYNGSNKALFEAISKLDKLDSQKGCGQSLYCYELH